MRTTTAALVMIVLSTLGCSDGEEPLQGWEESDVEIVNEGSATGTTRQIVAPGDPLTTPLTATDVDTTAALELTDEALEGDLDGQRDASLGDRLPDPRSIPSSPGRVAPSPRPSERSATQRPAPSGSTPGERRVTTPRTAPERPEQSEEPDEREPLPEPRRPAPPEPEPEDVEPEEPPSERPDPEPSQPERERDVKPEPPEESETEEQDPPPPDDTEEDPPDSSEEDD